MAAFALRLISRPSGIRGSATSRASYTNWIRAETRLSAKLPLQDGSAGITRGWPQFGLDAHELVVFRRPVAARQAAGLDLAAVGRHRQVGNRRILGFAGAMAHH